MKRTPIRRYARLESRTPMRKRRAQPRDRGELKDTPRIRWLRTQPCRVPGCWRKAQAHHLRHDEHGAALGALIKDDRRAISLCWQHHVPELHGNAGFFAGWSRDEIRAWENAQLAEQRVEYARVNGNKVLLF